MPDSSWVVSEQADELAARVGSDVEFAPFTPSLSDIVSLSARSLVVVGDAGAGKTALAEAYEAERKRRRQSGDPVAVRFDLGTWRAGTPVRGWLISQLSQHRGLSSGAAKAVVDAGLVHPVLDGIDELAPDLRPEFQDEVVALPFPVLLTSRPISLDDRVPTMRLEIPPLHATLARWPSVAQAVHDDPAAPVAIALKDPVNRFLFEQAHSQGTSDPSALTDRTVFPDEVSIGEHLLNDSVPVVQRDLKRLVGLSATLENGGVAWWRLAGTPCLYLVWAAIASVAVAMGIQLNDAVLTKAELLVGQRIEPRWMVGVAVALLTALSLGWLARPRPPVEIRMDMLGSRLTGIGAVGLLAAGSGFLPQSSPIPALLLVLFGIGMLSVWLRGITGIPDESRMDPPVQVLKRDRVFAVLRLFVHLIAIGGLVNVLSPGYLSSTQGGPVLAAGILSVSGSASVLYMMVWLFPERWRVHNAVETLENTSALVRREGGMYHFRSASVSAALADVRFEQLAAHSNVSAAAQVSALRHQLAELTCRRLDVRGFMDDKAYSRFLAKVTDEIVAHTGVIVASASAARHMYLMAKESYARALLRLPLDKAEFVAHGTELAGYGGWLLVAFATVALLLPDPRQSIWSVVVLVGCASFLWWVLKWMGGRTATRRFHNLVWYGANAAELIVTAGLAWSLGRGVSSRLSLPAEVLLVGVVTGLTGALVFAMTAKFRRRTLGLMSDDPSWWPADTEPRARKARSDAAAAHRAWVDALVERGVRPLVATRLAAVGRRSYSTVLSRSADVRKLGNVSDVTQYVPTETSRRLATMLEEGMRHGAIGISGPRGAGKSTVLKLFGELRLGERQHDRGLVVSAPTNYVAREFLSYLYATLCTRVIDMETGVEAPQESRSRKWPWILASAVGALAGIGAWQSERIMHAVKWMPQNWRLLTMVVGGVVAVVPLLVLWARSARARRHKENEVVAEARRRLDSLRFVETSTLTHTLNVKPPAVAEFGGSRALARAAQIKTFPELVSEFQAFLTFLTSHPRGARVVLCIDEVDKISTAEEAERFLNDIKAVFGVDGCFFLVAVSDDALATYSRRTLAVRTAFDSAFDTVVGVPRFELADTRRLLVQRAARLPEPFVWLCHVMSGGLPRELNRTVRELRHHHEPNTTGDLSKLTRAIVHSDLTAVTEGLSARLADRFDRHAIRLRQQIVNASRLAPTADALRQYRYDPLPDDAPGDLLLVQEQFRAYLTYAVAVLRAFDDNIAAVVAALENTEAPEIEFLARARAVLAVDPVAAVAHVSDWNRFEAYFPSL